MIWLLTYCAGALGAVARLVADAELRRRWEPGAWATVLINLTGSFVLGMLAGWAHVAHGGANAEMILGTGFCGGYTTFSTISVETVRLLQARRFASAASAAVGCLLLSVAAAFAGWALVA